MESSCGGEQRAKHFLKTAIPDSDATARAALGAYQPCEACRRAGSGETLGVTKQPVHGLEDTHHKWRSVVHSAMPREEESQAISSKT
eukprot:6470368-Amphidinium_carterae.1